MGCPRGSPAELIRKEYPYASVSALRHRWHPSGWPAVSHNGKSNTRDFSDDNHCHDSNNSNIIVIIVNRNRVLAVPIAIIVISYSINCENSNKNNSSSNKNSNSPVSWEKKPGAPLQHTESSKCFRTPVSFLLYLLGGPPTL